MPNLAKAELHELDHNFDPLQGAKDHWTKVQFNPDSLKVSFANQLTTPSGAGDKNGPQANQFVGAGTTKLSVTLVFDVTSEIPNGLPEVDDVRRLTERIAFFIIAEGKPKNKPTTFIPPAVRFIWGSFQFDGFMESMDETLELFSPEGRPLRATVAIGLTQQKITTFKFHGADNESPAVTRKGRSAPGTSPVTEAPAGSNLQSLAAGQAGIGIGVSGGWQAIASANGIENPRLLNPGALIDLNISASASVSVGVDVQIG